MVHVVKRRRSLERLRASFTPGGGHSESVCSGRRQSRRQKIYTTVSGWGRSYVGRQIKTYTTKPKTWLDKAWLAAEGVGWYMTFKPIYDSHFSNPTKTNNMVAPYMMEERYYE